MSGQKAPKRHKHDLDLTLFVAGSGARSLRTIDSVKRACEKYAPGAYRLSVVDIYFRPQAAVEGQIVAVPTLIRQFPHPVQLYVGEIAGAAALDRHFGYLKPGLA